MGICQKKTWNAESHVTMSKHMKSGFDLPCFMEFTWWPVVFGEFFNRNGMIFGELISHLRKVRCIQRGLGLNIYRARASNWM